MLPEIEMILLNFLNFEFTPYSKEKWNEN